MAKHIIWDWNGTLLDDVQPCVDSVNQMLAARQLPALSLDRYLDIFDFPVISYYERLGFDLKTEDWDAIANEFHRYYEEFSANSVLREGVEETLNTISEQGLQMSILSASEITVLERMLKQRKIQNFFQHVVGLDNRHASSKLEQGKQLLKAIGTAPDEIILIGDTNHDHDVSKELGIQCILLTGGHQSARRLTAETIIEHPLDLLTLPAFCK